MPINIITVSIIGSLLCLGVCSPSHAESPSPVGLLKGVYSARSSYKYLSTQLNFKDIKKSEKTTQAQIFIKEVDQKRILKISPSRPGEKLAENIIVVDGVEDEVRNFRMKQDNDLEIFDIQRAVDRGVFGFDPRVLGLSESLTLNTTLKGCLVLKNPDLITLGGKEIVNGVNTWKVIIGAKNSRVETTYWIEMPLFRVHKRLISARSMKLEIDSFYSDHDDSSPFPSKVISKRYSSGKLRQERIFSNIVWDFSPFKDTELSIKAMEIPVNTPVNDYRISQIVGYWDGEKITKKPVQFLKRK